MLGCQPKTEKTTFYIFGYSCRLKSSIKRAAEVVIKLTISFLFNQLSSNRI